MSTKVRENIQLALTPLDTKLLSHMELSYKKNDSYLFQQTGQTTEPNKQIPDTSFFFLIY